jgi:predicted peptidase
MKYLFCTAIAILALFLLSFVGMKKNKISLGMVYRSIIMKPAIYKSDGHQLPYRLYKPKHITNNERKPLVIVLHSGPRRGEDNFSQLSGDVSVFVSRSFQEIEKTFVLAPQCPDDLVWIDVKRSSLPFINYDMAKQNQSWRETLLLELIDELSRIYNIDRERVYLMGRSMGADGVWDMLYRFPDTFAGAIILNGRTDPKKANRISKTPIRHFHGSKDSITPIENALEMQDAISRFDCDFRLKVLNAGHGVWENIYSVDLYRWLLRQQKNSAKINIKVIK